MCNLNFPNNQAGGFDLASQNLTRRYTNGVKDNSLVGAEAGAVGSAVNHFKQDLAESRADGQISPWERANLRVERQAVSQMIYGLRHNGLGNLPQPNHCDNSRPAVDPFQPNLGYTRPAVDPFHPNLGYTRPAVDPFQPNLGYTRPAVDPFHPFGGK